MSRIRTTEAICLRSQDYHESSKLVTLFTFDDGKITGIAKGARRPKSRFGSALNIFARSRIIYYFHQQRTSFTITDAELLWSPAAIALEADRFLAAQPMAEFLLKALPPHDPNQRLYQLFATNLQVLAQATTGFGLLTFSFLLKAASFLGFRPELRRCLVCGQPIADRPTPWIIFDPRRGGSICYTCSGNAPVTQRLSWEAFELLGRLLSTPSVQVPGLEPVRPLGQLQSLIVNFLGYHFTPVVLNSLGGLAPEPAPSNENGAPLRTPRSL